MMQIMARELAIFFVICISSIIAPVMHGKKFKKVQVPVLAMMFKVMIHQVG